MGGRKQKERKMERIVQSTVKCPKCKSIDVMIIEVWRGHTIEWEQLDGKFDRNDGVLEHGYSYKLESTCKKCKHTWTIRKATSIDDVIK
jgi:phage FluMu protein Com